MEYSKDKLSGLLAIDQQVFLYLADTICGYLSYGIPEDDFNFVAKKARELTGTSNPDENLIFAYDNVDDFFEKAYRYYLAGNYFESLSELYEIETRDYTEAKYYRKKWVKLLKESIVNEFVEYKLVDALNELYRALTRNNLMPEKAMYIYKTLEQASEHIRDERTLYRFYDTGVALNCHLGASLRAQELYEKCDKLAHFVDIEDYTRTRNRYATALCDNFEYEKALRITDATIDALNEIMELSRRIYDGGLFPFGKLELAKTYSLAGQCYAFMENEKAAKFFDMSLSNQEEQHANYFISLSYMMHYFIDSGDETGYRRLLETYMSNRTDVLEQLEYIYEEGSKPDGAFSFSYALFMYLKGLNSFYSSEEIVKVWPRLKEIDESLSNGEKKGHPYELINKYMALIALRAGDETSYEKYMPLIWKSCSDVNFTLIDTVSRLATIEVQIAKNGTVSEETAKLVITMFKHFKSNYPWMVDGKDYDTTEEQLEIIRAALTYMYR